MPFHTEPLRIHISVMCPTSLRTPQQPIRAMETTTYPLLQVAQTVRTLSGAPPAPISTGTATAAAPLSPNTTSACRAEVGLIPRSFK